MIPAMRALDKVIDQPDGWKGLVKDMLIDKHAYVVKTFGNAPCDKHRFDCEAVAAKKPTDCLATVMSMAEDPSRVKRRMEWARVRNGEI
jgi:hypothetical protein